MPPRRRTSQNNASPNPADQQPILGPRSALTSFLREQGITGHNARLNYSNRRTDQPATGTPPADDSSSAQVTLTSADADAAPVASTSATPAASTDANAEASTSSGTKRKAAADPSSSKGKKGKKAAKKPDVDEDGFTIGGLPHAPAPKKGRYEDRTPGAIAVCAQCGRKFTVSKYTASNPHGAGLLCSPCTSESTGESIEQRATFPSASKGLKKPVKKKAVKAEIETLYTPVPTLQQTCVALIGQYIEDVEALGDIGHKNLDRAARVVCKNRALTGHNLKLFLDVSHRELRLYDCTNVKDQDLASIAVFCPHLERLALNLCGRLDDDVIDAWLKGFKELRHLSLYAPYLVTAKKWVEFLSQCGTDRPSFSTFQLRMSARFDDAALEELVAHNATLEHLTLSEIGRLTGASLAALHPLEHLASLDLSRLGTPQGQVLEDDDVIALLRRVGAGLDTLTLDGNELLTERVLTEGVARFCPRLRSLSIEDCGEVQTEGIEALFAGDSAPEEKQAEGDEGAGSGAAPPDEQPQQDAAPAVADGADVAMPPVAAAETGEAAPVVKETLPPLGPWASPGLHTLNLHRVSTLAPSALRALLAHSGKTLQHLNLHSCDDLDSDALFHLADHAPELEVLDVSFVRAVDDFFVKHVLDRCKKLKVLFLHGNNRVTSEVPKKAGVQLRGLENAMHTELPGNIKWEGHL
ncbi:UV-damaged DNA-binding protein RAD7 [Rhodotorula paludigena]|uniref:UV-damaged DNA-binding protein RAD7 n=1 Tax=Rhodotorula paludigena TaxID=86838 RepID=UPI003180A012